MQEVPKVLAQCHFVVQNNDKESVNNNMRNFVQENVLIFLCQVEQFVHTLTHHPSSQGWAPGVLLLSCSALCCFVCHCHVMCFNL